MARRWALALRALAVRSERGPLRSVWALAYALALRAYSLYLSRGEGQVSVYATGSLGSGQPIYGLSDIDVAVVLGGDGQLRHQARDRVRRRWERLERASPLLAGPVLDRPLVLDETDLRSAGASALIYGLGEGRSGALYLGADADRDRIALYQEPGLDGFGRGWRLINGLERRPRAAVLEAQEFRVAAWLELQGYWRWLLQECVEPDPLRVADLCVKLMAEPVRILLWLIHGEQRAGRDEVLERGRELIPDEEPAIAAALELRRGLPMSSTALLDEFLPALLRLSVPGRFPARRGGEHPTRAPESGSSGRRGPS